MFASSIAGNILSTRVMLGATLNVDLEVWSDMMCDWSTECEPDCLQLYRMHKQMQSQRLDIQML